MPHPRSGIKPADVDTERTRIPPPFAGREGEYLTPVMYAIALGYTGIMTLLIRHSANLRIRTNKGRTALMFAARFRRLEVARQLVVERIEPDAVDRSGFAAIDWLRAAARERIAFQSTARAALVVGECVAEPAAPCGKPRAKSLLTNLAPPTSTFLQR